MDIISYNEAANAKKIAKSKSQVYNQETQPTDVQIGDVWQKPSTLQEFTYVNDGTNDVWVETTGVGALVTVDAYTKAETDAKIVELAPTPDLSGLVDKISDENVGGTKTFTSFPVTPSTAPTTDYQVANKKYVDTAKSEAIQSNYGFKNYIINGGFDVWQRGTTKVGIGVGEYSTADRWITQGRGGTSGLATIEKRDLSYNGVIIPSLRWTQTEAINGGSTAFIQKIEGSSLRGKTVTLSFIVANTSTSARQLYVRCQTSNGAESGSGYITLDASSTKKYTKTFTISDDYTTDSLYIGFNNYEMDTFQYYFAQVQLEEGSVATPFEQRPYGLELSLCQRYYQKSYNYNVYAGADTLLGSINCYSGFAVDYRFFVFGGNFKTQMRTTPSVTIYSGGGDAGYISAYNSDSTKIQVLSVTGATDKQVANYLSVDSGSGDSSTVYSFHYIADAEL